MFPAPAHFSAVAHNGFVVIVRHRTDECGPARSYPQHASHTYQDIPAPSYSLTSHYTRQQPTTTCHHSQRLAQLIIIVFMPHSEAIIVPGLMAATERTRCAAERIGRGLLHQPTSYTFCYPSSSHGC